MKESVTDIIELMCCEDPRYHQDAYLFVLQALNFSQKKFRRFKHVNGKELLEGIKELVMKQFGPMGVSVLQYWGIKTTEDFGNIVFNLIEHDVLTKTDQDCLKDFHDVYDFDRVFNAAYRNRVNKEISRMR